ncbi:hypothetical protein SAMN02745866_03982 [Alteromonadaceae bacterium Bs31]|nr:hypothetical protein SAMN02745866_03982 [Alteromonadaceae bacterium Bs31]
MSMPKALLLGCLIAWVCCFAQADNRINLSEEYKSQLISAHEVLALALASKPGLVKALTTTEGRWHSLEPILKINNGWEADEAMRAKITGNSLALEFRSLVQNPEYAISEILLTDGFGALVACFPAASDYWQGDEEKFYRTATMRQPYISAAQWDESTAVYSFFIAYPVPSEAHKPLKGVIILGLDVTQSYLSQMSLEDLLRLQVTEQQQPG